MWLVNLSNLDLIAVLTVTVTVTGLVAWLVPAANAQRQAPTRYSGTAITAYDRALPMYALFATGALVVGALHGLLKNLPGIFQWLLTADHAGEMARDLSNTHIFVVGVGTVLLSGLTWYVLPRIAKRPLYSPGMATASFWFTTLGVSGFYLAWLVLGLVEGGMVQNGMAYADAKALVGKWHSVPLRATGMMLGLGYWTYTLNTILTAWFSQQVEEEKPHAHLLKYLVTGSVALMLGTVQGVLQVLPNNEAWIQAAGAAGHMIDPVSHAHINLVLGAALLTMAFFIFLGPRLKLRPITKVRADLIFWIVLAGGGVFYSAMLLLGLYEGHQIVDKGLTYAEVSGRLGVWHTAPILLGGLMMTVGVWLFILTMIQSARCAEGAIRSAFYLAGVALFIGTLQGTYQTIGAIKLWYMEAGALGELLPSAHAQLNILGGLTPLALLLGMSLLPRMPLLLLAKAVLWLERGALAVYAGLAYVGIQAAVLNAVGGGGMGVAAGMTRNHMHPVVPEVLAAVAPIGIGLSLLGFAGYGVGALQLWRLVWRCSSAFRTQTRRAVAVYPAQVVGPLPTALRRLPPALPVGVEFAGAFAGFPGLGWFLAGVPVVGWPLAAVGPGVAWALLPVLFSPFGDTFLTSMGLRVYLYYFPGTALLSSLALALLLRRRSHRRGGGHPRRRVSPRVRRRKTAVTVGASVVGMALLSTLLVPLLGGSVGARVQYTPLGAIPEASRGLFFASNHAFVRPYPWYEAPADFPPDSLALASVETLVVQDRRVGDATDYRLIALDGGRRIPFREVMRMRSGALERLTLAPAESLAPGRYLLVADQTSSMYGGSVEYYFGIDPALPPLAPPPTSEPLAEPSATASTSTATVGERPIWNAFAALSAVFLCLLIWLDYRRKPAPHRLWWALGMSMFALASSLGLWHAFRGGWSPFAYRLWYLAGALLAAAFLGHGTGWLLLPKKLVRALSWGLVFYSGVVLSLVFTAPLELTRLPPGDQLSGRAFPDIAADLMATPRFHTILLNSYGAALLVLGALYSAWRLMAKPDLRHRMWGTIAIAAGGLAMGAVGTLNRFGFSGAQSLGEVVAIGFIFVGFKLAERRRVLRTPVVEECLDSGRSVFNSARYARR